MNRDERSTTTSVRPSKFLEGSMNDKVSQRPPGIYTGEDEAMERYVRGQEIDQNEMDVTYDAGIDSAKPSGMFRFGKAIASAFNPVHIWQGVNGIWKEKEKNVLQERQAKAAEAYAELKKSGYQGTQFGPVQPPSHDTPAILTQDTELTHRRSFRDSGIDVDSFRSSERKNSDQMTDSSDTLKVPQTRAANRSVSPLSEASSARKSSMHFRRTSLQNLKKVKSHIRLPSAKIQGDAATPMPSTNAEDAANPTLSAPGLRTEPSKRDIAKQYRLSKKVSDLENKLETARRELEQSMANAPPVPNIPSLVGRKPFKPGTLATLPSERNMAPENLQADEAGAQVAEDSGKDGSVLEEDGPPVPQHTVTHGNRNLRPTSKYSISTRRSCARFSADDQISQFQSTDEVAIVEAAKSSTSKRRVGQPRKYPESESSTTTKSAECAKDTLSILSQTPHKSPLRDDEEVPPLPSQPRIFDPVEVDQAKIIAMRSARNSGAPFASIPEDIHNLWEAFPEAKEDQLSDYIRSQPGFSKMTDPNATLHPLRSTSSFLGPPISASPMRTRSKRNSKRGISPPPPSLASAKKSHTDDDASWTAVEGGETTALAEINDQPKAPKKKYGHPIEAGKYHKDKPLPNIQKEDYDWPEDVF